MILESAGIAVPSSCAPSVNALPDGDQEREYIWYAWGCGEGVDVYTYRITGAGDDFANWKLVEHEPRKRLTD